MLFLKTSLEIQSCSTVSSKTEIEFRPTHRSIFEYRWSCGPDPSPFRPECKTLLIGRLVVYRVPNFRSSYLISSAILKLLSRDADQLETIMTLRADAIHLCETAWDNFVPEARRHNEGAKSNRFRNSKFALRTPTKCTEAINACACGVALAVTNHSWKRSGKSCYQE